MNDQTTDKTGPKMVLMRLTQDDHARLLQLAAAQERSMAAVVRVLIREAWAREEAASAQS